MSKNIVICSDGTGNRFQERPSNVARLVELLALNDRNKQVAVYDQGIGTDARRWKGIEKLQCMLSDPAALRVLRGPLESWWPKESIALLRGLAFGYGLAANVRQMYEVLSELYEDGDKVFLFGFSRGAFTVRALAGLIYRCGLPRGRRADFTSLFGQAWELFLPMKPPHCPAKVFRAIEEQRECPIHFLGIWDTVKSYGGLCPVMLPHLRHNPIVATVRHALALDEKRGWFEATTWGLLDLDTKECAAWSRLTQSERDCIENHQDIEEVWFTGVHADIGGGIAEEHTARIALRWMVGEAVCAGLSVNVEGERLLQALPEPERTGIRGSQRWWWRLLDFFPRRTIDNGKKWPEAHWARPGRAPRHPDQLCRNHGEVTMHESVGPLASTARVRIAATKTLQLERPVS